MSKDFQDAVKKVRKDKIPVSRMISNNWYMVKYAAGYDKRFVWTVIGLFCLLQMLTAVYDTVLLKIVIDMLEGPDRLRNLLIVLLVSLVVVIIIEWIRQLMEQWSKGRWCALRERFSVSLWRTMGKWICFAMTLRSIMTCTYLLRQRQMKWFRNQWIVLVS